ncbi:Mucin-associated surface protein (MASP) [Trypanosoma cruzi]|uniref:Mucin-associated surface protein (MASP), putative n=2 Tax=Trypanosoma cruzi TaxID=5693 RepID=Q4E4Y3_TRYCC|nr:mucin-associated surface protein (MASP), putative [Trypanosoma cruzi]EAN99829.1 mucin-associated surface protein (MASP), putative [Trypanosoma cruzi]PWV21334.1 Mucin-associated surface protein (MASP) [Trypanosoma cruzi]|eukprot:XP_821680.1 mucin-associated surface protein (MASP) [Trypanosoma cruzi strain CL Brener]
MAMMMTGRVLLVCALCVLWCVAGGVYARDRDNNAVGGCVASGGFGAKTSYVKSGREKTALTLPLRSILPIPAIQAEDEQEARESEEENTLGSVGTTGPGSVSGGGHGTVVPGVAGDSGGGPNLKSPSVDTPVTHGGGGAGSTGGLSSTSQGNSQGVLPEVGPKPQQSSLLEEKVAAVAPTLVEPPKNSAPAGGESVENDAQSRADRQPRLDESTKGKLNLDPTEARALPGDTNQTLQGGEKAVPDVSKATEPEPKTQKETEPSEDKNDRHNTHASTKSPDVPKGNNAKEGNNEDPAHTPVTPQSTSNGSQQLAAVSPSTGTPTSNEEKSTVAKETEDPQPSDTSQTEKRQTSGNGKVDDSDSSTTLSEAAPQTAITITAAQTNHTTTPGDSDGSSTAVSHTTSPLLLLLLVACAAAVAIV